MTRVFISYSHKDEALRAELVAHLALLTREGVLDLWTDHDITAGGEIHSTISQGLEEADIVLLLISQNFNNSEYCANVEMKRALERHEAGQCVAVPVLLRPCDWQTAPYAKFNAIPRNNRPVTEWSSHDAAFAEIVQELRELLRRRAAFARPHSPFAQSANPPSSLPLPRPADGGSSGPSSPRATKARPLLIGAAALVVVAIVSAAVLFNFVRQPSAIASTNTANDTRVRPGADVPLDAHADTPPVDAFALPGSKSINGDKPEVPTTATVTASPLPVSSVSRNGTRVAEHVRKSQGGAVTASDECLRLTGLLAKGALEQDDQQRLKEACNR